MFPGVRNWRKNTSVLKILSGIKRGETIWARGPFACNLALALKQEGLVQRVIFDARGAYHAELNEYNVTGEDHLKKEIGAIEKQALQASDALLAVSSKLTEWWLEHYHFTPKNYRVIPCTLSENFEPALPSEQELLDLRKKTGFNASDVVLVYSGSSAGWQSFSLVDDFLHQQMSANPNVKLIFLSSHPPKDSKTFKEFSNRIVAKWVEPAEVRNILLAADYGLLVRENSVTNQVASPVKFAEYLSCGLQVIISEQIGDFASFVQTHNCGILYDAGEDLLPVPYSKKKLNHVLALMHFSKRSEPILKKYSSLLAG